MEQREAHVHLLLGIRAIFGEHRIAQIAVDHQASALAGRDGCQAAVTDERPHDTGNEHRVLGGR
ncbi:MAG: hypothetical protein ACSLFN_03545 [Candidatus Limnocylindrales bacterium]